MTAIAAIESWLATPAGHALGRALLHFLWEGAVAAGLLAVLLAIVRSARARYTLAIACLLSLPVAFAVTWVICARPADSVSIVPHVPRLYSLPLALPTGSSLPAPSPDRLAWLVPLWMAGVAICYARSFAGWFAAQRLRRRGVCAAPEFWQERLRTLGARLRISRPVLLLESCLAEVPVTFGWFRPVILLPIGLVAGLPTDQVEAILLHELAHIRRADYALNLLATFIEGLLFYHPAVWWISHVVRAERENCCDDAVLAHNTDARSYAAALARLEHNRSLAREAVLAANGGNLMNRIRRLVNQPERQRSAAPVFALALLLVAVAGALAWSPAPQSHRDLARQTIANTYERLPLKNYMSFLAFIPQQAVPQPPQRKSDSGSPATFSQQAQEFEQLRQLAAANPASPYEKWLNEDVAYIITDKERAAFRDLQTDAEREQFIEQFWQVRDPTPGTPENEFKQEHYRRIAYANQYFSAPSASGWRTDGGRIYIIYGPPDEIDNHSNETAKPPYQLWRYRFIEGMGQNVIIQFTDRYRDGSYHMDWDPARNLQPMDPLVAVGKRSDAVFKSSGGSAGITVGVWRNGLVGFGASADLASKAYSGTWQVSVKGDSTALMQGPFDSRGATQTFNLKPGAYTLTVIMHDPNGAPFSAAVNFTVD